jgi:hypothetical protein
MAPSDLAKKLQIKPGSRLLLLNVPEDQRQRLDPLPEGVQVAERPDSPADAVYLFVRNRGELESHAAAALGALEPGGLLWIAYPKKSSKIPTDINRDAGWGPVAEAGWEGVAIVSVDDVWSALRFRPLQEVGRKAARTTEKRAGRADSGAEPAADGLRDKHQKPDGYEISGSKTLPVPLEALFAAWQDETARGRWLGEPGLTVRKATPHKTMRITWPDKTNVDVYFYAKGEAKSQVTVQHGKLPDAEAAAHRKAWWAEALERLRTELGG